MKRYLTIGVALVAAAAAGATTFLAEDFEGTTFPPPGWSIAYSGVGGGSWQRLAGGPSGYYAYGAARGSDAGYIARLQSPWFVVAAGATLYFRFDYHQAYTGGSGVGFGVFWFRNTGGSGHAWQVPASTWRPYAGSYLFPAAGSYRGVWESIAVGTYYDYTTFGVDGILIADEPLVAVTPSSLGRVKALYR